MGGAEAYRANGSAPGVEGLDKLYPGALLLAAAATLHAACFCKFLDHGRELLSMLTASAVAQSLYDWNRVEMS